MKRSVMLTIASLLYDPLIMLHVTDDIVRGMDKARPRKSHCHSHPGRLAIRHAGAHRTATWVHHPPSSRDHCDGHARNPLEGAESSTS